MDKLYKVVFDHRSGNKTGIYTNRGIARNAFSNMRYDWRGMLGGEIWEAVPEWVLVDKIERDQTAPWRNSNLVRAKQLRERAQRLINEAESLEGLDDLFRR